MARLGLRPRRRRSRTRRGAAGSLGGARPPRHFGGSWGGFTWVEVKGGPWGSAGVASSPCRAGPSAGGLGPAPDVAGGASATRSAHDWFPAIGIGGRLGRGGAPGLGWWAPRKDWLERVPHRRFASARGCLKTAILIATRPVAGEGRQGGTGCRAPPPAVAGRVAARKRRQGGGSGRRGWAGGHRQRKSPGHRSRAFAPFIHPRPATASARESQKQTCSQCIPSIPISMTEDPKWCEHHSHTILTPINGVLLCK